jgi:hypothetical protein
LRLNLAQIGLQQAADALTRRLDEVDANFGENVALRLANDHVDSFHTAWVASRLSLDGR